MRQQIVNKKPSRLIRIISRYWLTFVLLVVLITLIRQSFIMNQFPFSLAKKQQVIDTQIKHNQALDLQNKAQTVELEALTSADMERLESEARQRFGLIKDGETYYQTVHE